MITVTSLKGEIFVINHNRIERIHSIPETKIILSNDHYYLVQETVDEIIQKSIEYSKKILDTEKKWV